ncbi:hypothetical protein MA16_Dca005864 [Dendrobium catenatum]|uniref:Uncharacterized protein n=1 Tax=Dendrobium catenatum TaxID=906689 RepID=A0A2I0WXE5_9ASPA|nr:hypothetical protein MA16_Dca005864 [Dendrobium catenatum]
MQYSSFLLKLPTEKKLLGAECAPSAQALDNLRYPTVPTGTECRYLAGYSVCADDSPRLHSAPNNLSLLRLYVLQLFGYISDLNAALPHTNK